MQNLKLLSPCNLLKKGSKDFPSRINILRNISADLDETRNSSENKNKGKILDNEAILELAHNNIIFLLDRTSWIGTVMFGQKIQPAEIPSNIAKESWFKIFVTEIHNPYTFWFHVYNTNELDSLIQDMKNFYQNLSRSEYQIRNSNIKPGQVCAALFMGMWYRAKILEEPIEENVKLFFVDYGIKAEVPAFDIKYLLNEYSNLGYQAYRGTLAFIKPVTHRWARDATYAFLDMVNELLLYAKVIRIDQKERRIRMIITYTNDERGFQINEALVLKGLAKFCDEEYKRYNQNEPLIAYDRHFQEKYPTFDMLESGEYPTFIEIGTLLAKGIDFKARQDEHILPDVDENCSLEKNQSATLDDLEDTDVESETNTNLEKNKQVLNPCTNPFIPKNRSSNTEDIMPNSLRITPQYNT